MAPTEFAAMKKQFLRKKEILANEKKEIYRILKLNRFKPSEHWAK